MINTLLTQKTRPAYIPADYESVIIVGSEEEFLTAQFTGAANVILCPRPLITGDFNNLAVEMGEYFHLGSEGVIIPLDRVMVQDFAKSPKARVFTNEIGAIERDMDLLPLAILRLLKTYSEKDNLDLFHLDGLRRYGCCYNGPATLFAAIKDIQYNLSGTEIEGMNPLGSFFSPAPGDLFAFAGAYDETDAPGILAAAHKPQKADFPCLRLIY